MVRSVATLLGRNVRKKSRASLQGQSCSLVKLKKIYCFFLFDKLILKKF